MNNYELMQIIIQTKDKKEVIKILKEKQIDVKKSKYC